MPLKTMTVPVPQMAPPETNKTSTPLGMSKGDGTTCDPQYMTGEADITKLKK